MGMLVGFQTEGWDHLILRVFLAKLLDIPEEEIKPDQLSSNGRGWHFVMALLPKSLRRFYGKCAQLAVVGVDNDGNRDLMNTGAAEDPEHPRHWIHADGMFVADCRWCQLRQTIKSTRPFLNWIPSKRGGDWPVVLAVPVEAIEAWLLAAQALLFAGQGSLHAENERRDLHKRRFYGKPVPTKIDVETKALPLIRALDTEKLRQLEEISKSFGLFAKQVESVRCAVLSAPDCW